MDTRAREDQEPERTNTRMENCEILGALKGWSSSECSHFSEQCKYHIFEAVIMKNAVFWDNNI
jgi:hypothetical protein